MSEQTQTAVLFDLAGVLVESRAAITSCVNHSLAQHDFPERPAQELDRFTGPPLAAAFCELSGEAASSPLVSSCVRAVGDRFHDIEGARGNSIRSAGVTWGVGTVLELQLAGAAAIVAEPAKLPAAISSLFVLERRNGRTAEAGRTDA
jgi:phosphoglycolate phosphatase-like HAD superfamily hydrolase